MTATRWPNALAAALLWLAVLLLPGGKRVRYREQWQADLDGATQLGLTPPALAAGMLTAALATRLAHLRLRSAAGRIPSPAPEGAPMPRILPIGPLALFLGGLYSDRAKPIAIVLAVALVAALVVGVGLLLM